MLEVRIEISVTGGIRGVFPEMTWEEILSLRPDRHKLISHSLQTWLWRVSHL